MEGGGAGALTAFESYRFAGSIFGSMQVATDYLSGLIISLNLIISATAYCLVTL